MNKLVKNTLVFASGMCGGVVAGGLLVIDLALKFKHIRVGVKNAIKDWAEDRINDILFGEENIHCSLTNHASYNKPVFDTKGDAEFILTRMEEIIDKHEYVTVADLCDLIGIDSGYADSLRGWTTLSGVKVIRVRSGYTLDLPAPMRLARRNYA